MNIWIDFIWFAMHIDSKLWIHLTLMHMHISCKIVVKKVGGLEQHIINGLTDQRQDCWTHTSCRQMQHIRYYSQRQWGRAIHRPVGLDHNGGPSAIPCGSSQSWILNGNLRDFFYKSRNIPDCCSIYICGFRLPPYSHSECCEVVAMA